MPPIFTGQLNVNEISSAMFNMIISQNVFSDNFDADESLVDKARVDGTLYGDTKLYYAVDVLKSHAWGKDSESPNLLALNRPNAPETQAIVLNIFRQIDLTLDNYLSKRAWSNEGAFMEFISVMSGMLGQTKAIYDEKTYNAFIGTDVTSVGKQLQTVSLDTVGNATGSNKMAVFNLRGLQIGERIANVFTELKDANRNYNDYEFMRKVAKSKCKIVFNAKYANEIKHIDLPAIFHNDGLIPTAETLPAHYFGTVNAGAVTAVADSATPSTGQEKTSKLFSLVEQEIETNGTKTHYFPGENIKTGDTAPEGTSYTEDGKVICKIYGKLPVFMSAFVVETAFFNAKSLTENRYLTWGHNTLEHFKNYPCITIKEA